MENKKEIEIKKEFKIFENNQDLIYLDSAASSLTPDSVVEKMNEYYFKYRSNIDRAISKIAIKATNEYDESRKVLANHLGCEHDEIIWTSGATMASNMLIDMIAKHDDEYHFLNEGDEVLTTILEHHSSLVPIQEFAKKKKMSLKFLELRQNPSAGLPAAPLQRGANAIAQTDFYLDLNSLKNLVSEKTKIVSICLASNVTGQINDIKKIITEIKKINKNVFVICDMTAAFGHIKINLNKNDKNSLYDFIDSGYFSMHKAFGPTGVGALFIKRDISRNFSPTIFGGGMISHVSKENSEYRSDIKLFEAGTANIAGVIGAGEAIRFLEKISENNFEKNILDHNQNLVKYFFEKIEKLNEENDLDIKVFSDEENNMGIISFQVFVKNKESVIEVHPHDVAEILAREDISVRAGHHCAEPLMNYLNTKNGLTRISFHIYNDENDIDKLIEGLLKVKNVFGE